MCGKVCRSFGRLTPVACLTLELGVDPRIVDESLRVPLRKTKWSKLLALATLFSPEALDILLHLVAALCHDA